MRESFRAEEIRFRPASNTEALTGENPNDRVFFRTDDELLFVLRHRLGVLRHKEGWPCPSYECRGISSVLFDTELIEMLRNSCLCRLCRFLQSVEELRETPIIIF